MQKAVAALATAIMLGGCATQIHAPDQPNQPPTVALGTYQNVKIAPISVVEMEGDSGDLAAVERIESELRTCLESALPQRQAAGGRSLLIEPIIPALKKVNSAERVFLGAFAGSSAVLLTLRMTDEGTKDIVAEPTFYARAAAMGAAYSFGATDNIMLTRIANDACNYVRDHR